MWFEVPPELLPPKIHRLFARKKISYSPTSPPGESSWLLGHAPAGDGGAIPKWDEGSSMGPCCGLSPSFGARGARGDDV